VEKRKSGKAAGDSRPITGEEKSSEGRSSRALAVERDGQGSLKAETAERVAKPCVRHFLRAGQRFQDASSKEGVKRRAQRSGYAEGQRSSCEVPLEGGLRST
jgi:hypothetical protein